MLNVSPFVPRPTVRPASPSRNCSETLFWMGVVPSVPRVEPVPPIAAVVRGSFCSVRVSPRPVAEPIGLMMNPVENPFC